ncbi:MAG: hypothetical protein HYZ79_05515 [Candidatus Melainabacteria bacterium]|nr:hypothetical protein [Candidatus Melainabacteria bacterium]
MSKVTFNHSIAVRRVQQPAPVRRPGCQVSSNNLILIVSLESALQDVVAYNLGKSGYRVLKADSESLALPILRKDKPEIVILDLNGRQDIDSSTLLKTYGDNAFLLLVSQPDIEIDSERVEVLEKPFQVRDLIQKITALSERLTKA